MQSLSTNINELKRPTTRSEELAAERILTLLDKTEQRNSIQFSKQRDYERQTVRGTLILSLQSSVNHVCDIREEATLSARCWSISQSGASFLFTGNLTLTEIIVGLSVLEDEMTWFQSQIVRKRKIPNVDFWEYGVKFLRKINP